VPARRLFTASPQPWSRPTRTYSAAASVAPFFLNARLPPRTPLLPLAPLSGGALRRCDDVPAQHRCSQCRAPGRCRFHCRCRIRCRHHSRRRTTASTCRCGCRCRDRPRRVEPPSRCRRRRQWWWQPLGHPPLRDQPWGRALAPALRLAAGHHPRRVHGRVCGHRHFLHFGRGRRLGVGGPLLGRRRLADATARDRWHWAAVVRPRLFNRH